MSSLLILISVLAFTCNGFGTRLFQTRLAHAERRLPLYQALFCGISMVCFWGYGKFALPSLETCLYGVIFGILFFLASYMGAKCYMLGSMALTSVIMNMSLIVPLLYSIFFLKESITLLHVIGFCFFCASVICSAVTKDQQKKGNLLWLLLVMVGFCSNGMTATIQKVYAIEAASKQDSVFLGVAYLTAALCFLVTFLLQRAKRKDEVLTPIRSAYVWKFIGIAVLAGVGSFGGNLLLGQLAPKVDAAILYPCINGGLAICTSLISFFFFKEKPTAQKVISILLGCAAIVVLNLGT